MKFLLLNLHLDKILYNMIELCKIIMRNTFITLEYYFTIDYIYRIKNIIFYEFDAFFEFGSANHR